MLDKSSQEVELQLNIIETETIEQVELIKKVIIIFIITLTLHLFLNTKVLAENSNIEPNTTSEAVILIDENSGRVLYEKNPDKTMYPASLTKVATAIYAIEKGNLDDIITVSKNARKTEGTRVFLEEGEMVPLKKLIQGMLVNSGNDAAVAIAEHLDGSEEEFAKNINAYLKDIGIKNTNFENPHGLYNDNHTTTARDLAKITQYALKSKEFRTIFGMKELNWDGESWDTTIYTHHKLMREQPYEGVTGGKTGYVDQSGNTLITTATKDHMSVIAVVLKGSNQNAVYDDTIKLLDYAFTNYKPVSIPKGKEYTSNNKVFVTGKEYTFPIVKNEDFTEEITNNGLLVVRNQYHERIASIPLKATQKATFKENKENQKDTDNNIVNKSIIIAIIAILGLFFVPRFIKTFKKV